MVPWFAKQAPPRKNPTAGRWHCRLWIQQTWCPSTAASAPAARWNHWRHWRKRLLRDDFVHEKSHFWGSQIINQFLGSLITKRHRMYCSGTQKLVYANNDSFFFIFLVKPQFGDRFLHVYVWASLIIKIKTGEMCRLRRCLYWGTPVVSPRWLVLHLYYPLAS